MIQVRSKRFWIGAAISLVFIVLLLRKTDLHEVWYAWSHAQPQWLLAGVAVYFCSITLRAFRYRFILLSRISLTTRQLFPILSIGYASNNILPARTGELVRAYVLGERYEVSKMFALGTIAVERLFDGLALIGILITTALFLHAASSGPLRELALLTIPVFAIAFAVFLSVLASPRLSEMAAVKVVRLAPERWREKLEELALAFISGLGSLRHPKWFTIVVVSSAVTWTMEGIVFACVGQALDMHFALGYYLMAASAANLAITVPSSQGGIGPYDFFAAQVMILAGASASVAAAFALAVHALVILPITLVGLFFLWRMHLHLNQAVRSEQAEPLIDEVVAPLPEA
jgi:glycosyltransferase 2 family protein